MKHAHKRVKKARTEIFFSAGFNVIMRALTLGMFSLSPLSLSPPLFSFFFFFTQNWVRDAHLYQNLLLFSYFHTFGGRSQHPILYLHRHCCLISNGEGVFMNVHKHISCQVPVLCMLCKHPAVLIVFSKY